MRAAGTGRCTRGVVAAACCVGVAGGAASGQLDPFGGGEEPEPHVRLSLLSDHASIEAGQAFELGVSFEIDEHWHIYWHGRNDTGYAPRFRIEAPEGFEVGEARWPAPTRYVSPGDILDHVYEGRVTLLVPVKAPETLASGDVIEFRVTADWLVCEVVCIPEEGEAELTVRTGGAVKSKKETLKVFEASRARIPKPAPAAVWTDTFGASPFAIRIVGSDDSPPVVRIAARGAEMLRFFPAREGAVITNLLGGGEVLGDRMLLETESHDDSGRVAGVLEIVREGGSTFYTLAARGDGPAAEEE